MFVSNSFFPLPRAGRRERTQIWLLTMATWTIPSPPTVHYGTGSISGVPILSKGGGGGGSGNARRRRRRKKCGLAVIIISSFWPCRVCKKEEGKTVVGLCRRFYRISLSSSPPQRRAEQSGGGSRWQMAESYVAPYPLRHELLFCQKKNKKMWLSGTI